MRIAYACYWNVFRDDGVAKKIAAQVGRWRAEGDEVEVFALSPRREGPQRWEAAAFCFDGAVSRVSASARMLRAIRGFRPDVVYLRYELLPPPLLALPRLHPTVVELNSDEHAEYRLRRRRAQLAELYGRRNWRALLGRAAGIVTVTDELVGLVEPLGRPTLTVANGIDLAAVPELPALAEGRPALGFVGSPGLAWHGVDKIVDLAEALPEVDVLVVGADPGPRVPPNLQARPQLPREEYAPLLARVDAAIGTAAFHRNGMEEGCPLKVREYLALGLPVVLPYRDTDLEGLDDWFLLRLPNEERNLVDHAAEIRAFAERVRGRRVPREAVAARIGVEAKERRRLDFLRAVTA